MLISCSARVDVRPANNGLSGPRARPHRRPASGLQAAHIPSLFPGPVARVAAGPPTRLSAGAPRGRRVAGREGLRAAIRPVVRAPVKVPGRRGPRARSGAPRGTLARDPRRPPAPAGRVGALGGRRRPGILRRSRLQPGEGPWAWEQGRTCQCPVLASMSFLVN